nr:hypothetical protein [Streptomyces sp. NRRL F-525]
MRVVEFDTHLMDLGDGSSAADLVRPVEAVEDVGHRIRVDARTLVLDAKRHVVSAHTQGHGAAGGGVHVAVAQQVGQQTVQLCFVTQHECVSQVTWR